MDEKQKAQLNEPPPPEALAHRPQGGKSLTYVEGWWVIQQMNAIFGPGGWFRGFAGKGLYEVDKAEVQKDSKTRYDVAMLCEYRIDVHSGPTIEDVGYGAGQSYHGWADAYESAAKEAVTDALKRCCRSLGNALGNCLYDKDWLKGNALGKRAADNSFEDDIPASERGEPVL